MLNVNGICSTRRMTYGVVLCTQAVRGSNEMFLLPHKFHEIKTHQAVMK